VCHILDSIDSKILVWGPLGAKSLPETLKANKTKQNKPKQKQPGGMAKAVKHLLSRLKALR
jgi:hypothetical protein